MQNLNAVYIDEAVKGMYENLSSKLIKCKFQNSLRIDYM
jgi:hypothetical protein